MTTHYFNNQGNKIAYESTGHGPVVICVPSMGDLRGEYRFLAPQLAAAGYRAISLDVRGHGETATDWADYSVAGIGSDIVALIRELKAGPAIILGTSMAAGAAVWAAAEASELIAGMVLIDPFVHGNGDWQSRLLYSTLFTRPWGPSLWRRYYTSLYPTRKPADFADYVAKLQANLAEPGRMESLLKMMLAPKAASEERLPAVKAPALVVMGSKDPDFKNPESEAKWVAERVRGAYKMIPEAGHYPHAEMPEVTGPVVLAFIQSLTQKAEKNTYATQSTN
jgi:pimeloyl-ACP methyl ester carboxylesterase